MGKKEKNFLVINIEYAIVSVMVFVTRLLPLRAAYFVTSIMGTLIYLMDYKHRRRAFQHILHAGIVETPREARRLVWKNFQHLAKVWVEIIKIPQLLNDENMAEHVKFKGSEEIREKFYKKGQNSPMIIVTAHFGNWELAGKAYSTLCGFPLTSIMRPLNNPKLGKLIYSHRESDTHKTVSKEKGIKPHLKGLKNGESVAIVADQHASTSEGVETVFFGHPARSHATPAFLHLKTGVPIVVAVCKRLDNNLNFEFRADEYFIMEPGEDRGRDIQKLTQMYTSALEKLIKEAPEQWMWPHRRWLDINRKSKYMEVKQNDA